MGAVIHSGSVDDTACRLLTVNVLFCVQGHTHGGIRCLWQFDVMDGHLSRTLSRCIHICSPNNLCLS